jgi:hypothetical protein
MVLDHMTTEDRIKLIIGDLVMQTAMLSNKIEELSNKVADLERGQVTGNGPISAAGKVIGNGQIPVASK